MPISLVLERVDPADQELAPAPRPTEELIQDLNSLTEKLFGANEPSDNEPADPRQVNFRKSMRARGFFRIPPENLELPPGRATSRTPDIFDAVSAAEAVFAGRPLSEVQPISWREAEPKIRGRDTSACDLEQRANQAGATPEDRKLYMLQRAGYLTVADGVCVDTSATTPRFLTPEAAHDEVVAASPQLAGSTVGVLAVVEFANSAPEEQRVSAAAS